MGFHAHSGGEGDYPVVGDPARRGPDLQPSQGEEDEHRDGLARWGGLGGHREDMHLSRPLWPACPLPVPSSLLRRGRRRSEWVR